MNRTPAQLDSVEHEYEVQETAYHLLFQEQLPKIDKRSILERSEAYRQELDRLIGTVPNDVGCQIEEVCQRNNILYYEMGYIGAELVFQILFQKEAQAKVSS